MYGNSANSGHQRNMSNRNVSQYGQSMGFQFTTSISSNNQSYVNSNHTGTASADADNKIFPGTASSNIRNMLPFTVRPDNSIPFRGNTNSLVNLPYGNNVYPMLPVSTRMPPPMIHNIPLHLPPPAQKVNNSLSIPFTNNLYNQSHSANPMCHSEMQVKDANSQQKSFSNQSASHYGQNVGFQFNTLPSNNQGCINSDLTQAVSIPSTAHASTISANIKNVFSFPMNANNSVAFAANVDNLASVQYNNNIQSTFSVSTRMPPPMIPNINLNLPPPVPKNEPMPPTNYMPLNPIYDKKIKLTNFLNRFIKKGESDGNSVKIPVYRTTLKAAFSKLKELLHHKSTLKNLLHADENTWKSEMQKVSALQNELSEICQLVSAPYLLSSVLKKLKSIKKKREQKKTKINILSAKRKKELIRKELHEEIDKWLDDIKEKNLKRKREAEMKKEADFILLEVRRKIYEAKRTIEKIKVFEKLRQARQANSVKKGLHILPEHDKSFEKKISILRETMVRQLADYEAEENAMKVMLETEQEGQLSFMVQLMKTIQEKKQTQIIRCLFGNSDDPQPADPLYLFHQYHTAANHSIQNLLQIRCQWDIYLADDGEAIPQQWVIPTIANSSWEKWLVKTKD